MIKPFFTLILSILIVTTVSAQKSHEQVYKYEVKNENAFLNYFTVDLYPVSVYYSGYHFNFGLDIGTTFQYGRVNGKLYYNYSYWNRINNIVQESSHNSINKNTASSYLLGEIGITLFKKEKTKPTKIILEKTRNIIYYSIIDATNGSSWAIDFGIQKGRSYYQFGNNSTIKGLNTSTDIVEDFVSDPNNLSDAMNGTSSITINDEISTYLDYQILSIGISKTISHDITIDTDKFGQCNSNRIVRIYGAILFNSAKLDNVNYQYTEIDANNTWFGSSSRVISPSEVVLDGYTQIMKTGFKLGIEKRNMRGFNESYGIEGGIFPGASGNIFNNLFLSFKVGFQMVKTLQPVLSLKH